MNQKPMKPFVIPNLSRKPNGKNKMKPNQTLLIRNYTQN